MLLQFVSVNLALIRLVFYLNHLRSSKVTAFIVQLQIPYSEKLFLYYFLIRLRINFQAFQ